MGLPAGWVTDVPGLTRNDQLRILGNGVMPRQALAALTAVGGAPYGIPEQLPKLNTETRQHD